MPLEEWMALTATTQGQLARHLGICQTAVSRYLSGQRIPRPSVMLDIYEVSDGDVSPNDLVLGRTIKGSK
jgi:predicted transcriptional regulator